MTLRSVPLPPQHEGFGWRVWSGSPSVMAHAHQHDEIEINLVRRGTLDYLWGGGVQRLTAGQVGLFWGASPHRLLDVAPDSRVSWLTLPSVRFQRFALPADLREAVWSGVLLVAEADSMTAALFEQWEQDPATSIHEAIAELEVQAWLRRFALRAGVLSAPLPPAVDSRVGQALWLAHRLQQEFAQPLKIRDLAADLGMHPTSASGLFRQVFGLGIREYLTRCRLAQAQYLLIASDLSVLDVALESGFASPSRFFAVFAERHGCSPRAYRQAHRAGSQENRGEGVAAPSNGGQRQRGASG